MSHAIRHLPSIAALRAFECAARHLSFTRAANDLAQTQGAISHQIRELEGRLGVRLFHRGRRGITLTADGERYRPFVHDALASLRAGASALGAARREHVLTVSMSPNFASKWLVPRLGDFVESHPAIDLRISASMEHVSFVDDGIDMAIRHGDGDWPALSVTRLCTEQVFPVCAPSYAGQHPECRSVHQLTQAMLLHDRDRGHWAHWMRAMGVGLTDAALERGPIFNQAALAIDAAVAGQGVALARSALVALDLARGHLVRPVEQALPADFAYWIVAPPALAATDRVSRFTDWLTQQIAGDESQSPAQ